MNCNINNNQWSHATYTGFFEVLLDQVSDVPDRPIVATEHVHNDSLDSAPCARRSA